MRKIFVSLIISIITILSCSIVYASDEYYYPYKEVIDDYISIYEDCCKINKRAFGENIDYEMLTNKYAGSYVDLECNVYTMPSIKSRMSKKSYEECDTTTPLPYYNLRDIDNNGIPELFISIPTEWVSLNEYSILGFFTYKDGKVINMFPDSHLGHMDNVYILDTNDIYNSSSYGATNSDFIRYKLNGDVLSKIDSIKLANGIWYHNDNVVPKSETDNLLKSWKDSVITPNWKSIYEFENE